MNARRGRGILASLSLDGARSASSLPLRPAVRENLFCRRREDRAGTQGAEAANATCLAREPPFAPARARALTRGVAIAAALATAATASSAAGELATDSRSRAHVCRERDADEGARHGRSGHPGGPEGQPARRRLALDRRRRRGERHAQAEAIRLHGLVEHADPRPPSQIRRLSNGRPDGDLACGTLSRSRQTVAVRGPESQFTISMNDPIFSVDRPPRAGRRQGRAGRGRRERASRPRECRSRRARAAGGHRERRRPALTTENEADAAGARRVRTAAAPSARR